MIPTKPQSRNELHVRLRHAIEHLEHVLPGQAAIKDFVHHNTLHGFEHLPFDEALKTAYKVTGNFGYLPVDQFRDLYTQGRIDNTDLQWVLQEIPSLKAQDVIFKTSGEEIRQSDIYLNSLLHPLKSITGCQLNWQIEELNALQAFQPDIPIASRKRLLESAETSETKAIADLWNACLHVLKLDHFIAHPEEMLDLTPEQAERMLSQMVPDTDHPEGQPVMDSMILKQARQQLDELLDQVGDTLTLEGLLQKLTGQDVLQEMRPLLIKYLAAFLDQGFAAWAGPDRAQGFYCMWRNSAARDLAPIFEELEDWSDSLDALPDDPLDAVIIEMRWRGLPEDKWEGYLQRLALELPGWSGMFLWRHNRPGYDGLDQTKVDMLDYLAVRLVLERLFTQRLCRELWQIEASFDVIGWYFRHHLPEFMVRNIFYNQHLPEYLATLAQHHLNSSDVIITDEQQWLHLAHLIWTWQHSRSNSTSESNSLFHHAWPLFRLVQHLGLSGAELRNLDITQVDMMFDCLGTLDEHMTGNLWLQAYERHYREQFFNAVTNNHGRGRFETREQRAAAQIIFCMDDREEGFRRHLEEHNPAIETLGAAGFFGVSINWRGLDDEKITPLCPVVVTPSHEIQETSQPGHENLQSKHQQRRSLRLRIKNLVFQETRRNLLVSTLLILLSAPASLLMLIAKTLAPRSTGRWTEALRTSFDIKIPTEITVTTTQPQTPATPEQPRIGFTDEEQADRVQGFLKTIGLQNTFAPLVMLMGHGSMSQNNPHLAAYDCGACSGRHGGPNARAFAIMANRPEIRSRLRERGIDIPNDTWVLGAEHNTCNENIEWYDTDAMPAVFQNHFDSLKKDLHIATLGSAHERSRRLMSAPKTASRTKALNHITGRATDFSQARPELGHATNAAAIIGRRSISQGAFFDRRVFLISYDPTQDPDGTIVENILLNAGPVGAGISLEYYFSTVNNEQYGCGTKITHNVTGLLGVMHGTSSDLRTGLPKQMIEIHEAMRLQVLVEASVETLTAIYERQPPLQQLIGNGWLLVSAKNPDSGEISVFKPDQGFVPWKGKISPLPTAATSTDWYQGHHEPLSPALIDNNKKASHA